MGSLGRDNNGYERVVVEETELEVIRRRYNELRVAQLNCPHKGRCYKCLDKQHDFVMLIASVLQLPHVKEA